MFDNVDDIFDTPVSNDGPGDAGHADVTNGADDVADNGAPVETGHGDQQAATGQEEQRVWAGKYKSPEELEKAYLHAQSYSTRLAQELAQLKNQLYTDTPQEQQSSVGQEGPQDQFVQAVQYYAQQAALNLLQQYLAPVTSKVEELSLQSELARMKATDPHFDEVAPTLAEVFQENPALWQLPNAVDIAYAVAKARYAEKALAEARAAGAKDAYNTQAAKQAAFVEGQKSKAQPPQKTPTEELLDSIFGGGNNRPF